MRILTVLKKSLIVLPILFITSFASAQSRDGWYKVFTGKVGDFTATLHLHKTAKNYSGYMWLQPNLLPLKIYYDEPLKKTDSLVLGAGGGSVSIVLSGILEGDGFGGTSEIKIGRTTPKKDAFQFHVNTGTSFTPFNYYYTEGFAKLPSQFENQSDCLYIASSLWPTGTSNAELTYKKDILQMLGIKTPVDEIGKWMIDEKNRTISTWKKTNTALSPKETSQMGLSLSLHQEIRILVMYENEKYLTLANYNSGYMGGAHETYATTISTFNKQISKKLALTDILNPAGIQALPKLLDQAAREQFAVKNIKPLNQNGFLVSRILPNQNFYLTETGIGFVYAPRTIKSFADGEISLLVPFTALKPYSKPGTLEKQLVTNKL